MLIFRVECPNCSFVNDAVFAQTAAGAIRLSEYAHMKQSPGCQGKLYVPDRPVPEPAHKRANKRSTT